jgi:hypothetical protein
VQEIKLFLKQVNVTFSDFCKPQNAIDFYGDLEYKEYNELLENISIEELTVEHLEEEHSVLSHLWHLVIIYHA